MPAGYSGTPLTNKLGIKPSTRIAILGAPPHYPKLVGPLPSGIKQLKRLSKELDFIHFFTSSKAELSQRLPALKRALNHHGALWISWPKKTSSLQSDLSGNIVRALGLETGLVDIKVCAVDEDWSGLKFVFRTKDRR